MTNAHRSRQPASVHFDRQKNYRPEVRIQRHDGAGEQQLLAVTMPDDDEQPCLCLECRRCRWWRDRPGERPAHFEHGSGIARGGAAAYILHRWLEKWFLGTPEDRRRGETENRAACLAAELWCAWAEVAEMTGVAMQFRPPADVEDLDSPQPPSSPFAIERESFANVNATFERDQLRFFQLTGLNWRDQTVHYGETRAEIFSYASLWQTLAQIEYCLSQSSPELVDDDWIISNEDPIPIAKAAITPSRSVGGQFSKTAIPGQFAG